MYATECTTKKLIVSETQVLKRETDTFRLRFRIPFAIFELLLVETTKWLRSTNQLQGDGTDACGRPGVPVYLKILAVLRILGRGTCADGIQELSLMSGDTALVFFHKFCK